MWVLKRKKNGSGSEKFWPSNHNSKNMYNNFMKFGLNKGKYSQMSCINFGVDLIRIQNFTIDSMTDFVVFLESKKCTCNSVKVHRGAGALLVVFRKYSPFFRKIPKIYGKKSYFSEKSPFFRKRAVFPNIL